MSSPSGHPYDAVVIGSGFGGCMAALPLVEAGWRVLMLERGDWVQRGPENWGDRGAFVLTSHYTTESDYSVRSFARWRPQGLCSCVGGPSVFYGGASFRFREADFEESPGITGEVGAAWPIRYADLEPHYARAEALLEIAGEAGIDPTEPPRSTPYPQPPSPVADPAARIAAAATELGLHPFRIPMAIREAGCVSCTTCDAFACAVSAKNDLATRLVPLLLAAGMELRPNTVVRRLEQTAGSGGWCIGGADARSGAPLRFDGSRVILAAGALATPHLLLASGLESVNPAGHHVGRYLMRHCNAMMYGYFRTPPNPDDRHHKQIAIHDFYFGDPSRPDLGKLGNLQQVMAPPISLIRAMLPRVLSGAATAVVRNLTGLLAIAEDQPRPENRVELIRGRTDRFGLPAARIHHRYTRRDVAARNVLLARARQVLRRAGARWTVTWKVNTFSHAVGTVRMGSSPERDPLDESCRYRGVDGLWVTDGSVFPTSAGVNPSLTIAANALRVGDSIVAAG